MTDKKFTFFEENIEQNHKELDNLKKKDQRIVLWRTGTFFGAVLAAAAAYDMSFGVRVPWGLLFILLFFLFVRLLHIHDEVRNDEEICKNRISILENYLKRIRGDWHNFEDDGGDFLTKEKTQATDLGLLGPDSLYQYIACGRTAAGRKRLAELLSPSPSPIDETLARQQRAKKFIDNPELSVKIQALLSFLEKNHNPEKSIDLMEASMEGKLIEVEKKEQTKSSLFGSSKNAPSRDSNDGPSTEMVKAPSGAPAISRPVLCIFSALSIASASAGILGFINIDLAGILPTLQLLLAVLFYSKTNKFLEPVYQVSVEMELYSMVFEELKKSDIAISPDSRAVEGLKKLAKIGTMVENRLNLFAFVFLNLLFLWDFHCNALYRSWWKEYGSEIRSWLSELAETEVSMSLAVIGQTRHDAVFPELLDDSTQKIHAVELTHPLIPEDKGVPNTMELTPGTTIITGSNMSGKTTWLRTLAISAVLSYAGAPVCAKEFAVSPMEIFTSIRVNDDIANGISTFYAEILRIKTMVEAVGRNRPMLIVIDEIFKGTNSADRITGAKAAIERLTAPHCITLVSTHDFELCDILTPDGAPVANLHFREHYEDGEIRFDYTLKEGRCQTTNAEYLLKVTGIMK